MESNQTCQEKQQERSSCSGCFFPEGVTIDGVELRPYEVHDYQRWRMMMENCPAREAKINPCMCHANASLCHFRKCVFRFWRGYL